MGVREKQGQLSSDLRVRVSWLRSVVVGEGEDLTDAGVGELQREVLRRVAAPQHLRLLLCKMLHYHVFAHPNGYAVRGENVNCH